MKISDINAVDSAPRVKPVNNAPAGADVPRDRVSVESTKEAESAVAIAQRAAGGRRAARAEQLEAQVRSGGYRPDPSRVAEQILSDAEIDARISAMLSH